MVTVHPSPIRPPVHGTLRAKERAYTIMKLIHNSRDAVYRTPFGAAPDHTDVHLHLRVEDADLSQLTATVRLWIDGEGETLVPMTPARDGFDATLDAGDPKIIWYSFIVTDAQGAAHYAGAPWGRTGGDAVMYDQPEPPSFQITVYHPRATRPTWYERGMVYQIFPDRYARDPQWKQRAEAAIERPHKGIRWNIVDDWDERPTYDRNPDGSIRTWDFYGGSLKGIQADLDRLEEMGVTAIYLNPIFEAASNHRYDTSDYLHIDRVLGTEDDFRELAEAAREHGMSIILDGVFNHTGDDSRYFNRYGNYPDVGAWQSPDSPWRDAYTFHEDGTYDCWWGIANMPALNENSERVQELLLGEDGVVRHWLRAGARGWRLDVADELSDGLIERIKAATLEERPDGLVLGEVWEDASNKISYSQLRRYLQGYELDSAMNYPFRDMAIGFLMGGCNAFDAAETINTIVENYPAEALNCALNLLGSHDKPRIASVLGGGPDESQMAEADRGVWHLDEHTRGLAKGRFWLATLMQMTLRGVPSIYYGDEFGLEGLSDPDNRRTLPTADGPRPRDLDMLTMINNAFGLRRVLPELFLDGTLTARGLNDDVLSYTRRSPVGMEATVLLNRSDTTSYTVRIPVSGEAACDVISGADLAIGRDGTAEVTLWPLGSAIAYGHAHERLQKPMEHGAGVVCHITSIPGVNGRPGTLGEPARRFIDHLEAMGMRYWQVLPVNPTDSYGSPYAGPSAFAGNPNLLEETAEELERGYVDFKAAHGFTSPAFFEFAHANEEWLDPYCAYMAVKDHFKGASRHTWPHDLQRYSVSIFADGRFSERARYHAYLQFTFDVEWGELMSYAHAHGVQIIGDIPMYVSDDSADAWSEPEMFQLDKDGRPALIAGTPPDRFAADGQIWGNPTYRWDRMREDGYVWWLARLRRAFALYDTVRLDHFLGFQNYFGIPAGATGKEGRWHPGPGIELFRRAHAEFGPLPIIAEDLGSLTPAVRTLVARCGFPGMDVLEFSDYDVREHIYPHDEKLLYISTHDTSTLVGFVARDFTDGDETEAVEVAEDILERALASKANVVMMQLQDVLDLGDEARMNRPGTAGGNWSWQADEQAILDAIEDTRDLMADTTRADAPAEDDSSTDGGAYGSLQANRHRR